MREALSGLVDHYVPGRTQAAAMALVERYATVRVGFVTEGWVL